MDIVIPTNYRPHRLTSTLSSLFVQDIPAGSQLILVSNGMPDLCQERQVKKLLLAFEKKSVHPQVVRTTKTTISQIKKEALQMTTADTVVLIDNDVLFTRHDTLMSLERALQEYDIGAASPLGYELDNDRPILNEFADAYTASSYDEHGIGEGTIALGFVLAFRRPEMLRAMPYWCDDLDYMEDQVIVHFIKKMSGYAYLRDHTVYHISYNETPTYIFDDNEVITYLQGKGQEYADLLQLRMQMLDGAQFSKPIRRRKHA